MFDPSKAKSSKPNLPASFSSKDFYDTHPPFANSNTSYRPPSNIDDTASDITGYRRSSNLQHQLRTRAEAHHSHIEKTTTKRMETSTGDPFLPAQHHSVPTRRKQRSPWDTFGEEEHQRGDGFPFFPLAQPDESPPMGMRQEELALRRYNSSGAFSDDFVLVPHLSRASSSRNVYQAMRRVGSASRPHGSSERLLGRSGTTSESDLSQIQEFQYHRLGLSPDERAHRSDQERLLRVSSPELDHDLASGMHEYSHKTRRGRAHAQPNFSPETSPRSKVARSNSYQRTVADAKLKVESPLSVRRCLSDDKPMRVHGQEGSRELGHEHESMEMEPPTRDMTNPHLSSCERAPSTPPERFEESHSSPAHQQTNSTSSSTGPEGILMSNSNTTNTETQITGLSLDLTSQSQLHGGEVSGSEYIERMDTQSGRDSSEERACLLSSVLTSRSEVTPVTNQTFWTCAPAGSSYGNDMSRTMRDDGSRPSHYLFSTEDSSMSNGHSQHHSVQKPQEGDNQDQDVVMISPVTCTPHSQTGLDIFPQAFSVDSNPVQQDNGVRNSSTSIHASQVPLLGAGEEDEELTPKEDGSTSEQLLRQHDSQLEDNVLAWVHGRVATSEAAASSLSSPVFTAEDTTLDSGSLYSSSHLPQHRDYNMMSPIPEASQELTSSMSMSQPNTNVHRLSGSHMRSQSRIRSVSPISEHADVSGLDDDTTPSHRHGSVSPFRHSAVTMCMRDQTSTQKSPSTTSEHGSTAQGSVLTTLNRPQQQLVSVANIDTKDQEQTRDDILSFQHQSRSRSVTPLIAASREGSVSSTRGGAVQADVQSEANASTTLEQLSGTSSGSREASVSSSTRAQVAIDVSNAVRTLTSQTTTQPSSSSHGIHSARVTNYSREPLQSSSESIGRGSQVRGSTPQSSSSAPARIQHSTDPGQRSDVARQVSPLTTTPQRIAHPQPHPQQQLQTGSVAAAQTSKRYSQQRVAELSTRSQQRINQDIEMMHLAISGMDTNQIRSIGHTRSAVVPRFQSVTQTAEMRGTNSAAGSTTTNHMAPSHSILSMDSSRTFRPITPAMMDTNRSRPASAPGITTNARPATSSPTFTPIPTSTHVATAQCYHHQQLPQQPPPSVPSIATVSQSVMTEATSSQNAAPQPPHVSADSYDYLPPYSPPQNGGRSHGQQLQQEAVQSSQQRPRSRQSSEPPLYPEPPPSYDEIFGSQNSSGRLRRRRGQRRQRGAETLPGTNEGGNRRSRSELRRSTSQNEGPIRPSSSQRRLASLTNLFRRARRYTHSGNSQNQRAVQSNTNTPSAADASQQMDANEYVASWVESYSRTPRPTEALRAGNTATHSQVYSSNVSHAARDVTNSRPHSSVYRGSARGGNNPVPYRPPPPFPTTESADSALNSYPPAVRGFSQISTDYSLSLNRASSDVGQSRISRNRSQPSPRPTSVTQGHQYATASLRPSMGNVMRRGMAREQRRPASAIVTSEVATTNSVDRVIPAHSGTDLARLDSDSHRSSPQQQQRQMSRHLDNTAHISTSCFDIVSPEPDNEQQRSQHTHPNQVENVSSSPRLGTEAAATEQQANNDAIRTASRQSQSLSLSQGHSQGDSSTLAANVNANNINTSASPRASNASSPITMVAVIGSNTSLGHNNSQPNAPSPDSNTTNLSQTVQDPPLAISPTSWSNSETRASGTSSLSSRAAARQRAEMRLSQHDVSSSDEESSQRSDRSQNGVVRPHHRVRQRRRRSQGSMSQAESLRSNSRVDVHLSQNSRPADLQERMETNVESQDQSRNNQTDVRPNGTTVNRVEEEQELQIGVPLFQYMHIYKHASNIIMHCQILIYTFPCCLVGLIYTHY